MDDKNKNNNLLYFFKDSNCKSSAILRSTTKSVFQIMAVWVVLITVFNSQKVNALEVQFGSKQKETIRFTDVPFKKKTYVHVEYLKGWRVLNEYVLDEEKSKIYQQEFKRLARKNKKFDQIADNECKTKIRMHDQMNRQFLCYEKWSEQDKKSFKTWTSSVQKDLFKNANLKSRTSR